MDLFELLWDTSQQLQINANEEQIQSNTKSIETAHKSVRDLRIQALKLTATCQALCDLLTQKLGIDESELTNLIKNYLSLEATRSAGTCPACGHKFFESRSACMYCGYSPAVHES